MGGERGGSWTNPIDNIGWWAKQPVKAVSSGVTGATYGTIANNTKGPVSTAAANNYNTANIAFQGGVPTSNAGQATKPTQTYEAPNANDGSGVLGFGTNTPGYASGRNSYGYYNDYTPEEVNALNSQLTQTDRLLASLGITRDTGLTNIGREYDKNVGRATEGQNQFNRDLNIRRGDNQINKINSLNRIDTDAENKFNSVMRMLGVRGAGVSSAAQVLAPHLVSRQASTQRADQFDTFGRNERNIDVAQSDSELKYKNLFEDLLGQRQQKENEFRQGMIGQENDLYGTRANILAQLDAAKGGTGGAAYEDYNNRLAANQITLDALLRAYQTPQYSIKPVDSTAPTLDKYTADPLAVADPNAVADPTATDVNAYLPWLQRKQKLGLV